MAESLSRLTRLRARLRTVSWTKLALALLIGTAGGAVFDAFGMPLAWMIGAMLTVSLAALANLPVRVPHGLRTGMITILGIMLGSAFTPEVLSGIGLWTVSLAALIPYIFVSLGVGLVYLRWLARMDPVSSYFAAAPGGFNEMVMVGGEMGGDERLIALNHSLRVMLVVSVIPFGFVWLNLYDPAERAALGPSMESLSLQDWLLLSACLIGAPLGKMLRIPAAALTGPMLMSAAIHLGGLTDSQPPGPLVAAAQVAVGSAIGGRFAGTSWALVGRTLLVATGLTTLMVGVTVLFAVALNAITGFSIPSLVLAYAPGGLAEMSLVALALDIDAAFVTTHHIFRILMVVTFAPALFMIIRRRRALSRSGD